MSSVRHIGKYSEHGKQEHVCHRSYHVIAFVVYLPSSDGLLEETRVALSDYANQLIWPADLRGSSSWIAFYGPEVQNGGPPV